MKVPFKALNSRGDTIVEVLISMSILALVMGAAYATTNRSLRAGIDAGIRSQATSFAQQQVEILKSIALHTPEKIEEYRVDYPFCIHPVNLDILPAADCGLPIGSPDPAQPFNVAIRYYKANPGRPTDPQNTFVIVTNWPSSTSATEENTVTLHYKPQSNYVEPAPGTTTICLTCTDEDILDPSLPTITLTRSQSAVISPATATITWSITKATSCIASSSPSSATWNGNISVRPDGTANDSRGTGPIPANSDVTFTVQCTRTGAGNRTVDTVVGSQRITSFTSSPSNPISYSSFVDISWASSHTTSCTGSGGSGSWAGGGKLSLGTQRINNMTASTTFNLSCTGPGGASTTAPLNVTVSPPPPPASYPPSSYPPASYPPSSYPPASYPPSSYPPSSYPPDSYPPSSYPPASYPPTFVDYHCHGWNQVWEHWSDWSHRNVRTMFCFE